MNSSPTIEPSALAALMPPSSLVIYVGYQPGQCHAIGSGPAYIAQRGNQDGDSQPGRAGDIYPPFPHIGEHPRQPPPVSLDFGWIGVKRWSFLLSLGIPLVVRNLVLRRTGPGRLQRQQEESR